MREVLPGDCFVDVGAFHGLYAIAVGKRVGSSGRVVAFEPDPANHGFLAEHIHLNQLKKIVTPEIKAVSSHSGMASFLPSRGPESRLETGSTNGRQVSVITLDDYFKSERINLLKIDVEGFEQAVLEGSAGLLNDKQRRPRAIFIEMHPFAWPVSGASSQGILAILREAGYGLFTLDQKPMDYIMRYGEAVARPLEL